MTHYEALQAAIHVLGGVDMSPEKKAEAAYALKDMLATRDKGMCAHVSAWPDRSLKWLTRRGAVGVIRIECNEGTGIRHIGARLLDGHGDRVVSVDHPVPHPNPPRDVIVDMIGRSGSVLLTAWDGMDP